MKSQEVSEPTHHPRPGRPPRSDWRLGPSLVSERPGTVVAAVATWTKSSTARVRLRLLEHLDDGSVNVEVLPDGTERRVLPGQVRRYYVTDGEWKPGDFVVMVGMDESEWRGVVVAMADLEVVVDTPAGRETVFADEVESAWSRKKKMPALKRGRIASDAVAERVGSEGVEARMTARAALPDIDDAGFAL